MNKIKVSIITVCYNSEKTIRRTIESVLKQTYNNIEYIIIDGASTDHTVSIIKEYISIAGSKLKYISEPDKGIYNAFNKGIRMSTGKLIGIINSDDFYESDTVQSVVNYMQDYPYQVLYGYCNIIKERIITVAKTKHTELGKAMIQHPTCFVTRKTYCKYGLFVEWMKIAADYELMLRFYSIGQVKFIQVPQILANFNMGGVSSKRELSYIVEKENAIVRYKYHFITFNDFLEIMLLNTFSKRYRNANELACKHLEMFLLMDQWMEAKQQGKNISSYLTKCGYREVAIYGMSYMGKRLIMELEGSPVHVKYGIDQNRRVNYKGIKIVSPDMELNRVDVIIVTANYYFIEIKASLEKLINCEIISLEEILNEI